jgi:hypothetical protein
MKQIEFIFLRLLLYMLQEHALINTNLFVVLMNALLD